MFECFFMLLLKAILTLIRSKILDFSLDSINIKGVTNLIDWLLVLEYLQSIAGMVSLAATDEIQARFQAAGGDEICFDSQASK